MINWIPEKKINFELINSLLQTTINTNQFTNYGPNVKKLENFIREKMFIDEDKSVIVVTNGAVGLHCLAQSISYHNKKDIRWATQAFTFPPSAQGPLSNAHIIDMNENDGAIDLDKIDLDNTDGIIVTNIFGNIVDIDKYVNWCNLHNKYLIFDNAATAYSFYKNKNCLNYGIGSIISFHHTKPFGFGEGGAIIVDKNYENIIRSIINFGINLEENTYYTQIGNNYKMSDISAVYILQYLEDNFDIIINKHFDLYKYFKKLMKDKNINNFKLYPTFNDGIIVPSCFCVLFKNYKDEIRINLLDENIFSRKYYNPLKNLPVAEKIYDSILCLPCTKDMNYDQIEKIINILIKN